jgi:hypothetical protein
LIYSTRPSVLESSSKIYISAQQGDIPTLKQPQEYADRFNIPMSTYLRIEPSEKTIVKIK